MRRKKRLALHSVGYGEVVGCELLSFFVRPYRTDDSPVWRRLGGIDSGSTLNVLPFDVGLRLDAAQKGLASIGVGDY